MRVTILLTIGAKARNMRPESGESHGDTLLPVISHLSLSTSLPLNGA